MKRHFSSLDLFVLRNHIPIDTLIEKHLMLPSKFSEGYFRFLCPLCNEFQTATKPKTGAKQKNRFIPLGNNQLKKFAFLTFPNVLICKMTAAATWLQQCLLTNRLKRLLIVNLLLFL